METRSSKSRKMDIFPQGPWFWSKNGHFSYFFFFRQYRPGKCLLRYSRAKKRLFTLWKQEVRKVKKFTFYQRFLEFFHFSLGFPPKMAIFPTFFFGNIGKENVYYDILERKNAFLGYKNNKFKKSKNWHFSKGVNQWFSSNNGHFSKFFLRQSRPGKCLLGYSRTKKRLSRL